jgi:hypothetical protein
MELEFEGLCQSCVDELHAEAESIWKIYSSYEPSEDELPF